MEVVGKERIRVEVHGWEVNEWEGHLRRSKMKLDKKGET